MVDQAPYANGRYPHLRKDEPRRHAFPHHLVHAEDGETDEPDVGEGVRRFGAVWFRSCEENSPDTSLGGGNAYM